MTPGFKLKYDEALYDARPPTTYDERKALAVAMAQQILWLPENDQQKKFGEFFRGQGYKRQTDLADALVQACQHAKRPDVESKRFRKRAI